MRLHRGGPGTAPFLLASVMFACACSHERRPSPEPLLDVEPRITLSPSAVAAGQPVLVKYRWTTGSGYRPPAAGCRVFFHLVAGDGAVLARDDHDPQPPLSLWRPRAAYTYERIVFTHHQFPGRLRARLGLFDPRSGERTRLRAGADAQGAYWVGGVTVTRAGLPRPSFYSGWSPPVCSSDPLDAPRCVARSARMHVPGVGQEAFLFLNARLSAAEEPARVHIDAGPHSTTLAPSPDTPFVAVMPLPATNWRDGGAVELRVSAAAGGAAAALCIHNAVVVPRHAIPEELLTLARERTESLRWPARAAAQRGRRGSATGL